MTCRQFKGNLKKKRSQRNRLLESNLRFKTWSNFKSVLFLYSTTADDDDDFVACERSATFARQTRHHSP